MTRRDILKAGATLSAAAITLPVRPVDLREPGSDDAAPAARERLLLDTGWRFHLGHADDPTRDFGYGTGDLFAKAGEFFGPSATDFDDGAWSRVDLPHDWAVDLPFINDPDEVGHGSKPLGRKYPDTSIGWYRRTFDIPATDSGRRISLEFDGVFRDCTAALNGHYLGRNLSGYAPFRYDVTDLVDYGGKNILVLRVDATEHEGWFYEGAGIYRHVWLVRTDALHVPQWGAVVTSEVGKAGATLTVRTEVTNDAESAASVRVRSTVLGPDGKRIATATGTAMRVEAGATREATQTLHVAAPRPWSLETPVLYRMVTETLAGTRVTDRTETSFGIRTMRFDPDHGFFLNGTRVELKGTCNHQDHAGVGSALPDRLQEYRIAKLKEMGSNAYRTSHNPPTPELLDACDRLGMLVLDETRMFSPEPEGLGQLERMIRRDRNHPCVFAWSIANEEWAVQGNDRGTRIATTVRDLAHRLDHTRPVTAAMDGGWGKGTSLALDVQGFNYQRASIDDFHRRFPRTPSMGSEVASAFATRGVYVTDKERGYISAYDVNRPSYGATAEEWWSYFAAREFLAGGFVWTGFDYRGEPSPYAWPCISSHFGILDTCGFPKDTFWYYQAWWSGHPVLHLFPHWDWAGQEGKEIEVWCHSNLDQVELFVNGASAGTRDVPRQGHVSWKVPYAAGAIEARGMQGGKVVLTDRRETTGPAASLRLVAWRTPLAADGEDTTVLRAEVVDSGGRVVPTADATVTFAVSGTGRLIGVGNGDPSSHESDRGPTRQAFNGLCCAIVQASKASGEILVNATAPGLGAAATIISTTPATPRPAAP
ncbi:MAG TPA: beta-galactosidase GalA [Gemmatimonadales bacterium]|nr:beta-galactosidase GalA [Gemmatimonadales bacterium]